ncbi:MAG: translation initiation factor 2 [Verrucomicrobia bacterium]|nr:translation initiation factor 2 [Verrucomicrobiota bacterium]
MLSTLLSRICLLATASVLLQACATVIHGTKEDVSVTTYPPDATVSDGTMTLQTPAKFNLKRNQDYILTISKPGYGTETVKIKHVISGAVAGNLILGGLIGWGIDVADGAQWRLEPDTIVVTLHPLLGTAILEELQSITTESVESDLKELSSYREDGLITEREYEAIKKCLLDLRS